MEENSLPQLILLDGATGSGKSSLLSYIREQYKSNVVVGAKLTTRNKRIGDEDWEFQFVERIPEKHTQYSFDSVGNRYAVDVDSLNDTVARGKVYVITCVNAELIEKFKADFNTVVIYLYRELNAAEFAELLKERGTTNQSDTQERQKEIESVIPQYLKMITLYDHVILNASTEMLLFEQLGKIFDFYGIISDSK